MTMHDLRLNYSIVRDVLKEIEHQIKITMLSIKEIIQLSLGKSGKVVDFENTYVGDHPDQLKIRFREFENGGNAKSKRSRRLQSLFGSTDKEQEQTNWENRLRD